MKNNYYPAIAAVVFTNILWGFDIITIDYMTDYMHATTLTFIRPLFGSIILIGLVFIKEKGLRIKKEDWPRVFLCGVMGLSIYSFLESMGVHRTSGSLASLILAMAPVFGLAADKILYKSKITSIKITGVIGSILGVTIVVAESGGGVFSGSLTGILFMFAATIVLTSYIVLVKPLHAKYSLLTLITGIMISGAVAALPLFLLNNPGIVTSFTPNVWVALIGSTFGCLVVGELTYLFGVSRLSVTTVAIFENILPIVVIIASFFMFGDTLTTVQLIGGAIILVSCTTVSLSGEQQPPALPFCEKYGKITGHLLTSHSEASTSQVSK